MSNVQEISSEVIDKVRCALEAFASAKRTPAFSDIEAAVCVKFRQDQWHQVLDPIYEELRAAGEPDLPQSLYMEAARRRDIRPTSVTVVRRDRAISIRITWLS